MQQADSSKPLPFGEASELANRLIHEINLAIYGQPDLVLETVCTFLAGGNILITGAPGLAKTTLVRKFASHLGVVFGRIQFTPDLMPTDIIGTEILNIDSKSEKRYLEFAKGPLFVNLLLADEINRASPRTQAAMLEAMQERQVTVAGKNYPLAEPFMVCATQNPFESEGTFPLPEAQLDRFLMHSLVGYPEKDAEEAMLKSYATGELASRLASQSQESVFNPGQISALLATVRSVKVTNELLSLVASLVRATRPEDENCPRKYRDVIWFGAGPRAGLSLIAAAKALALVEKKEQVSWSHIKRLACPVLRHRIRLSLTTQSDGLSEDGLVQDILAKLENNTEHRALGME